MRQLVSGTMISLQEAHTVDARLPLVPGVRASAVTTQDGAKQEGSPLANRRTALKRDPARPSSNSPMKSSWESDTLPPSVLPLTSKRRPTFSQVLSERSEKRQIVFQPANESEERP